VPNLKPGKYYWRVTDLRDLNRQLRSEFVVSEKRELLTEAEASKTGKKSSPVSPAAAKERRGVERETQAKPVRLTTTAPGTVTIEPDASQAEVPISWTPVNPKWRYRLIVSTEEFFSEEFLSKQVNGKGSALVRLPPGTYYYRIEAQRGKDGGAMGISQARKVEIRRKNLPAPPRVKSVQAE
jgi:hypothetical protein